MEKVSSFKCYFGQDCFNMRYNSSYHLTEKDALTLSRAQRKSMGTFYTPEPLAKMIAHDAIFAWISNRVGTPIQSFEDLDGVSSQIRKRLLRDLREISILDPAVGDGVFLESAGEWLSKLRGALSEEESREERKSIIVRECLFGVDLAKHAVNSCIDRLTKWGNISATSEVTNLKVGNSLVGLIGSDEIGKLTQDELDIKLAKMMNSNRAIEILDNLKETYPLHWHLAFPNIFSGDTPGFDIILGNPPYGSILGPIERKHISQTYFVSVGGGREGTWNSAAHFLVRGVSLLKPGGQLGFLVPNSILRVKQFSKTRGFLLSNTKLWKIVDEGNPFDNVTLEMVSIFCEHSGTGEERKIRVESRRPGLEQSNTVSSRVLKDSRIFPIYHDRILTKILEKGEKHLLIAGRGRDIPKAHVNKKKTSKFKIPYLTSGRSVRRYCINNNHVLFADDWFLKDSGMMESFQSELLVATKNYRYPRCIIKPKGIIHGGGIVKITPLYDNADLQVLGLILNSRLVKQICIRYLTNYSQLTCCLNTGIMEEIPIVLPEKPLVYRELFNTLSQLHSSKDQNCDMELMHAIERLADALVYSLYIGDDNLEQDVHSGAKNIIKIAQELEVITMINEIMSTPFVRDLERLGDFPAATKLRRY